MLVEHNMSKADDIVLAPFVFSKKAILFSCPDASQDRLGKLIDYPVLQTRLSQYCARKYYPSHEQSRIISWSHLIVYAISPSSSA